MKLLAKLSLCLAITLFAAVDQVHAAPGFLQPVSTGFAKIDSPTGNDVWIVFGAFQLPDGSITGSGALYNQSTGVNIYFDLTSTAVYEGDTYLSGPVTAVDGAGPPLGFLATFAVRDNGWGFPSPDRVTNFFAFPPHIFSDAQSVIDIAGPIPEMFYYPLDYGYMKVY